MLPLTVKLRALHESRASTLGPEVGDRAPRLPWRSRTAPAHAQVDRVRITPTILDSCVGYVVDSPDGRIGTVTQVRYGRRDRTLPAALVVRAGRSGVRLLHIPVSQLAAVRVGERRVILSGSPRITASEAMPTGRGGG